MRIPEACRALFEEYVSDRPPPREGKRLTVEDHVAIIELHERQKAGEKDLAHKLGIPVTHKVTDEFLALDVFGTPVEYVRAFRAALREGRD